MNYLSICSGIEAATVAWHPLGWQPVAFAEIDKFPSAVLNHHYRDVPNHGDFTTIQACDYGAFELLVGGTPCQSFSVAGLRGGLDDDRGNLALEFFRLALRTRPRWVVWENVPGVLSSNGGRDFGAILGGLGQCGYGFAYRVLDAQYFGVPQQRRRVFVVGHLGDWRRAAAVLSERHSLQGHSPPRRQAGEAVAGSLTPGAHPGGFNGQDAYSGHLIAHALRGEGFDASEDGTGRGIPLVPCHTTGAGFWQEGFGTLRARGQDSHENLIAYQCQGLNVGPMGHLRSGNGNETGGVPFVFQERGREGGRCVEWQEDLSYALTSPNGGGAGDRFRVNHGSAVRRLTPRECERLQGFPDDYTLVPYRKGVAKDGPRYKAIGNSMAVPVMRWIGERIQMVDQL